MQNKQNFNMMASDKRWVDMSGAMQELRREIKTLAPHPYGQERHSAAPAARGDDRDSMMATLLIDGFFGAGINTALADALHLPAMSGFDITSAVDLYDEYWTERQLSGKNQPDGAYELGEPGAIMGGFNEIARPKTAKPAGEWDLYLQDLPARRALEQNLSAYSRRMDMIQNEYTSGPRKQALVL